MLIVLGLGNPDGLLKIVIGQSGIEDGVASVFEEGWLTATGHAGPAVEEEDSHGQSSGLGSFMAGCDGGVWCQLFEARTVLLSRFYPAWLEIGRMTSIVVKGPHEGPP